MISLTERMKVIARLCDKTDLLFDVGCDHARISIALAESGMAGRVIASDINSGPLDAAKKNAKAAGVGDKMKFVLSDGLTKVDVENEIKGEKSSLLLISGMGGELTEKILSESEDKLSLIDRFVFSPQSKLNDFRRFLGRKGFFIETEKTVEDRGKIYFVIRAVRGGDSCKDDTDYELGPYFFNEKNETKERLLREKTSLYEMLCSNKNITGDDRKRYEVMLRLYREAYRRYEMQ